MAATVPGRAALAKCQVLAAVPGGVVAIAAAVAALVVRHPLQSDLLGT